MKLLLLGMNHRSAPLEVREVQVPSSVIPANSTAAVVNLTAANAVQPGFMTAFPCGRAVPDASNVNFLAGEARAVGAIVGGRYRRAERALDGSLGKQGKQITKRCVVALRGAAAHPGHPFVPARAPRRLHGHRSGQA